MPTDHASPFPSTHAPGRSRRWQRQVSREAIAAALLALVSLVIGVSINSARSHPLAWMYRQPAERLHDAVLALKPSASALESLAPSPPGPSPIIELEAFHAFVRERRGTVIDARAASFYRLGHIPGAINLPRETFAAAYARQEQALAADKSAQIVVYCSEADCPDAGMVAGELTHLGFNRVSVYREGWEEWTQAGLPQEGGAP